MGEKRFEVLLGVLVNEPHVFRTRTALRAQDADALAFEFRKPRPNDAKIGRQRLDENLFRNRRLRRRPSRASLYRNRNFVAPRFAQCERRKPVADAAAQLRAV